jgi:hypothetical protein
LRSFDNSGGWPPEAIFCASGANGLKCPLRSGSRKSLHTTQPAEFLNDLASAQ